jgi:hypothetical protein
MKSNLQNIASARPPLRKLESLPFASRGMPFCKWVDTVQTVISNGSNYVEDCASLQFCAHSTSAFLFSIGSFRV